MTKAPASGDRVRLVSMANDPDPILVGQTGTVKEVYPQGWGSSAWFQIDVHWDRRANSHVNLPARPS